MEPQVVTSHLEGKGLTPGEIVNGFVKNIKPYGVFIETDEGKIGLLHIEDISVGRIKSPEERFKIGQKTKVMVKSIEEASNRIVFTYKELLGTWEENIKDYKEGMIVNGIVRDAEKRGNGIFVELRPNLIGLAEYKENISYGQEVSVYIKKIIPEKRKIKLILR